VERKEGKRREKKRVKKRKEGKNLLDNNSNVSIQKIWNLEFEIWNLEFGNAQCRTTHTFPTFSMEISVTIKGEVKKFSRSLEKFGLLATIFIGHTHEIGHTPFPIRFRALEFGMHQNDLRFPF
jgi:hypothetical protein